MTGQINYVMRHDVDESHKFRLILRYEQKILTEVRPPCQRQPFSIFQEKSPNRTALDF